MLTVVIWYTVKTYWLWLLTAKHWMLIPFLTKSSPSKGFCLLLRYAVKRTNIVFKLATFSILHAVIPQIPFMQRTRPHSCTVFRMRWLNTFSLFCLRADMGVNDEVSVCSSRLKGSCWGCCIWIQTGARKQTFSWLFHNFTLYKCHYMGWSSLVCHFSVVRVVQQVILYEKVLQRWPL